MSIDKLIEELRAAAAVTVRRLVGFGWRGEVYNYPKNVNSGLLDRAADSLASTQAEILRLKAALAESQAMSDAHREHAQSAIENCASLKYSLSHANAALAPFAAIAKDIAENHPGWDHDAFEFALLAYTMTLAPFRAARSLSLDGEEGA